MGALQGERTVFPFMQRVQKWPPSWAQRRPYLFQPDGACTHLPLSHPFCSLRAYLRGHCQQWKHEAESLGPFMLCVHINMNKISQWESCQRGISKFEFTSYRALPTTGNQGELTKLQVLLFLHLLIWLTSCAQDDCHADHMQLLHALHTHTPIHHWILGMGTRLSSKKMTLWDNHSLIPRHAWRFRNETHT